MYGTCGDRELCVRSGITSSDEAWRRRFQPYEAEARDLISLSTPNGGRRSLLDRVGGCPVCVVEGAKPLLDGLIESVCCLKHWEAIEKWIKEHRKPTERGTVLCRRHMKKADQAWILARSENYIELGSDSVNIGHAAFAFKRQSTPEDLWDDDAVWICGSSDGVADPKWPVGSVYGTASYWWSAEDHPLDQPHFQDSGYDYAKIIEVDNGHWVEALVEADEQVDGSYCLIANNCADVTRRVLTAYGCTLPSLERLVPMSGIEWWHACPGRIVNLDSERRKRARRR